MSSSKEDLADTSTSTMPHSPPPAVPVAVVPPVTTIKPPIAPFSPVNPTSPKNFRESMMSTMSQYSGMPDAATRVQLYPSDEVKYVTDEQDEQPEEEHESEVDEESIKLGKLKTKPGNEVEIPTTTYVTNVKETIPARSSRRPMSVPPDTYEPIVDLKRRSMQINDSLEKLMHDAHSISSNEPIFLKQTRSVESEPLPKPRGASLPPRPTLDNIRRARDFSNNLQKITTDEEEQEEEPQVKSHKGKPVNKSIKNKNKPKKKLPFNYNTLINLLSTMNGTVIGEEFNQLNLPIQEKQLISQIIDSLSKLTSDMILDESRYEIGMKRLQLALNVLEGFV
ncbi:Protein NBA1 [Spathaspora sp. JA1]|nr:Protein NBA1 [Spathaspora sp. JA1]